MSALESLLAPTVRRAPSPAEPVLAVAADELFDTTDTDALAAELASLEAAAAAERPRPSVSCCRARSPRPLRRRARARWRR